MLRLYGYKSRKSFRMRGQILFDKWWGRSVGALVLLFIGWFVVNEFEGIAAFFRLLVTTITVIPESIQTIIAYYGALPSGQLASSLFIGIIFGAVTTAFVVFSTRKITPIPRLAGLAILFGIAAAMIAYLLGIILLNVIFVGLLAAVISAIVFQPDMRAFVSLQTLRSITQATHLRVLGRGALIGAIGGGAGSQILTYSMQHCTYSGEALAIERQIGILITVVSTLLVLIPMWTLMQPRQVRGTASTSGYFKGWVLPLTFLLPTLVSLVIFLYYPAVQITTLSLSIQRFRREQFVCLGNYINLVEDTIYRNSFIITLIFTAAIVIISMAMALGIALLASQKVRGASIYRTFLIWPYAISPVVTGAIFLAMFRQGRSGLINYGLFKLFNVDPVPEWFTNASLAPWVIIFASVWNALGFNILFYIAGLQNIPKDLLEAAEIDGANRLQRFYRITLPLLSPFTFFLLVTNVTFSFYGIYGAVDTLTQGNPPLGPAGRDGGATNVLIYKLYEDAFASGAQIGGAAAQSVILFLLVAFITLIQFRYLERRVTYAE